MNTKPQLRFTKKLICLAIVAAYGVAQADDAADIALLTKPESSVSAGAGFVSGSDRERALFGQYNGMRDQDAYGLLDINMVKRDDATGTWLTLEGRNLGLDNRDLNFSYGKQGDWKFLFDYNELVRHDPRTINTALQGAGSTTPSVVVLATPGTGRNIDLEQKRKSFGLGGEKWITPNLQFEASFKSEDKDGARMYGRGFACTSAAAPGCLGPTAARTGWALLMLPEPINTNTKQFEMKLNYSGDKLALSGGYYGSFFNNSNGNLTPTVPGSLNNAMGNLLPLSPGLQAILQQPMALQPDNQAHQLYLSGNYAFTPTTRGNFKVAYTHATQDDSFLSSGLTGAPGGRHDLNGEVNTTLAQVGLTARPLPKLSLLANVRYEDRKDKTPIDNYNIEGVTVFSNGHVSSTTVASKLEASYQFLPTTRGTLGVDYKTFERKDPVPTTDVAGISGLRSNTDETGYRAEIRQSFNEVFNASVGYVTAKRRGGDWYSLCTSAPCVAAGAGYGADVSASTIVGASRTAIFPMMMTDRNRDKWRITTDWTPTDRISVQLTLEDGEDHYNGEGAKGLKKSDMSLYGIDATWSITDNWKTTGYASFGSQVLNVNHSTGYTARLDNSTDTYGLNLIGTPTPRIQLGADISYTYEKDKYKQGLDSLASATNVAFLNSSGGLPDVTFKLTTFKLFGKYALEKNSDIRLDMIHQRTKLNEWTWGNNGVPFVFSDNSSVSMKQNQNVTFVGASYIYKWQ